jgi:hypothetical protein
MDGWDGIVNPLIIGICLLWLTRRNDERFPGRMVNEIIRVLDDRCAWIFGNFIFKTLAFIVINELQYDKYRDSHLSI